MAEDNTRTRDMFLERLSIAAATKGGVYAGRRWRLDTVQLGTGTFVLHYLTIADDDKEFHASLGLQTLSFQRQLCNYGFSTSRYVDAAGIKVMVTHRKAPLAQFTQDYDAASGGIVRWEHYARRRPSKKMVAASRFAKTPVATATRKGRVLAATRGGAGAARGGISKAKGRKSGPTNVWATTIGDPDFAFVPDTTGFPPAGSALADLQDWVARWQYDEVHDCLIIGV